MDQPDSFPDSSASSSSQVREEDGFIPFSHEHFRDRHRFPEPDLYHGAMGYQGNNYNQHADSPGTTMVNREDSWSCVIVVLTFWFFVSLTMILGIYGSVNTRLGPNTSLLLQPNPFFVQSAKVEQLYDKKAGLVLYGFKKLPDLDVVETWYETHSLSVPADTHKEWIHYLNAGSQIDVSYMVNSSSSSIFLIIAEGSEGLAQWLADPTYPNTTLSWNLVHGSGAIKQYIYKSSYYYVAVGNLNFGKVEVDLNIGFRALLYNTSNPYSKCTFANGQCNLPVLLSKGYAMVLTTPGQGQNSSRDEWYVRTGYGPRWATYIFGMGGMTVLMLLAFNYFNKYQRNRDETTGQYGERGSERAPLLSQKDDDNSSWGSSYESVSNDDDLEESMAGKSLDGKSGQDGENSNSTRRLCAICFDAPRDCFFLPCGHCVSCYECGTRIAEAAGTCPICRRTMKKVRRIFTV